MNRLTTVFLMIVLLVAPATRAQAAFGTKDLTGWKTEGNTIAGPEPAVNPSEYDNRLKTTKGTVTVRGDADIVHTDGTSQTCDTVNESAYFIPDTPWTEWQRDLFEDYLRNTQTPQTIEKIVKDTPEELSWEGSGSDLYTAQCGPGAAKVLETKTAPGRYIVYVVSRTEGESSTRKSADRAGISSVWYSETTIEVPVKGSAVEMDGFAVLGEF